MSSHGQPSSETSLRVRAARTADTASIVSITNAAFAIETFLDGTRTEEAGVAAMMKKGCFLVADEGDSRIVASVYIELRGTRGYFGMLAVDPSQQGRGLGRLMVEAAEEHCREQGCTAMDISVLSLRPELPPYYRKLGYVESGTEEFRPSRPLRPGVECHCIVMSKPL
jgi:ribosomal protein S18 acetylase RimI-like enzyme